MKKIKINLDRISCKIKKKIKIGKGRSILLLMQFKLIFPNPPFKINKIFKIIIKINNKIKKIKKINKNNLIIKFQNKQNNNTNNRNNYYNKIQNNKE